MGKYWGVFQTKGYDREDDVTGLDEDDMDQMGIANEDRSTVLEAGTHAEVRRRYRRRRRAVVNRHIRYNFPLSVHTYIQVYIASSL